VHKIVKPDPAHGDKSQNPSAFRLLERLETNPKVYYLSEREWVRNNGDNHMADGNAPGPGH
jgi:molybdopterin-containing oxidoreductase family iron-sulfur binding subunit